MVVDGSLGLPSGWRQIERDADSLCIAAEGKYAVVHEGWKQHERSWLGFDHHKFALNLGLGVSIKTAELDAAAEVTLILADEVRYFDVVHTA